MDLPRITVRLKPGRERSVLNRHPWVFSGAIADAGGAGEGLAVADVLSSGGDWLASGVFHPGADLALRLYSWRPDTAAGPDLVAARIREAVARRAARVAKHGPTDTDAFRLVFSEADGVSGLIVDRYAEVLSLRVHAAAVEAWMDDILAALRDATGLSAVVVAAEPDAAEREGVDPAALAARSTHTGPVRFRENGCAFEADPAGGQKTGFFLDQRDNRRRVAAWAPGRRMLSGYCYSGAFEVPAARAGAAEITGLDSSEAALDAARRHHAMNGTAIPVDYRKADVPTALRRFRDEGRTFDLIVLDPPRFVFSAGQKERGMRAYKDINLLAMKLLAPGGILATYSCSGLVSEDDFTTMLRWAAVDARRDVRIIGRSGQPFDHPELATFPESGYLKGILCEVA
ncbi:MAG: class I SAM-dependent rRNA methyltransferase [Lentisphaerae bacterium]|nr:class I SAM-dependent rRNA methyltransferase [Lentisphaerota bacterium]